MSFTMTSSPSEPCRLVLEGDLTIYHAAELKPQLLAALEQCNPLELDLAGVAEIDAAGLQLLLMAKRQAQASGRRLVIAGHSAAVLEVFGLCNVESFFGDPVMLRAEEPA